MESELLKSCYISSLELAKENGIKTIAFPAISCGVYGFPIDKAAEIAVSTVEEFAKSYKFIEKIIFVDINTNVIEEYRKVLNIT